MFRLIHT